MAIKDILKILGLFAALTLLSLVVFESVLRVRMFGLPGLNPIIVNSYVNILRTNLVQPSENLEVWYELKPNLDTLFRGATLQTNSQGLADEEYPFAKAPDTIRVAVIGSSWTMGAGVNLDETFHYFLEQQLNAKADDDQRYEFINFGVENYGLGEMMGVIKHKALKYDPDMILFVMTGYTPSIRWEPHEEPFKGTENDSNGWNSFALIRLKNALGIRTVAPNEIEMLRPTIDPNSREWNLYAKQFGRVFDELKKTSDLHSIGIGVAWLRIGSSEAGRHKQTILRLAEENGMQALVLDLEIFLAPGEPIENLLVNRVEKHPNGATHQLIAVELEKAMFTEGSIRPVAE